MRTRSLPACLYTWALLTQSLLAAPPRDVDEWLRRHKAEEFDGKAWVRLKIDEPRDLRYAVIVDSETNPYGPERRSTGTVTAQGLQAPASAGGNDWGKPLPWLPPKPDAPDGGWLSAGRYSPWVELPTSKAAQWHTAFIVRPQAETQSRLLTLHLEFASRPEEDFIFHAAAEPADEKGVVAVRMPTEGGEKGLRMVEGFTGWARRRAGLLKTLSPGPPPRLTKLKVTTWAQLFAYRSEVADAARERAELDFQIFESLGINSLTVSGVSDATLKELSQKYGIIDTSLSGWASGWLYTAEGRDKLYDYQPSETPEQRWRRVFDDYYGKLAAQHRATAPFAFATGSHFNLADEPGPEAKAQDVLNTPQLLASFREWLRAQGLQPGMLGASGWEQVEPADDRTKLASGDGGVEYARRFYHTRKFIDHYTSLFYRCATEAAREHYPNATFFGVNFQAGPMQFAFVGNNNDTDKSAMDWFEYGRQHAYHGIMTEDWVEGWDLGVGRIGLGVEMMRAAARKHDLPLSSYVVGGEAIRAKFYANLMHGVKEIQLYLYGPIGSIGPAWSDDPKALAETAEVTRQVKKFEAEIASAKVRPAKAALLVATTTDVMQAKGLYCLPERQNVYVAMKHAGFPMEVVSEGEVLEDGGLKNYSVLYVADSNVRADVQRKIAEWVEGGGRLWACVGAAGWDEYNQPSAALDAVFGVTGRSMQTQKDWLPASAPVYASAVSKFAYVQMGALRGGTSPYLGAKDVPVWGARLRCTPGTAKIVGTYDDGSPAVLHNTFGKGEALLVGALAGEAYVRAHYPEEKKISPGWKFDGGAEAQSLVTGFARAAGVEPPVMLSVPGVYTSVMDAPGATLVFLNNATGLPIERLTIRIPGLAAAGEVQAAKAQQVDRRAEGRDLVVETSLADVEVLCIRSK